nr:13030_t:CDS:2 [Entrophospora candida]
MSRQSGRSRFNNNYRSRGGRGGGFRDSRIYYGNNNNNSQGRYYFQNIPNIPAVNFNRNDNNSLSPINNKNGAAVYNGQGIILSNDNNNNNGNEVNTVNKYLNIKENANKSEEDWLQLLIFIIINMEFNELLTSTFDQRGGIDDNKTNIDVDLKSTSTIIIPNVGNGSYSPTMTPSPPPPSMTGASTSEEIEIKSNVVVNISNVENVEENDNANFRPKTLEESIVENVHSSASTTPNDSPKTLMSQQQEQRLIIPFVSPPPALSPVFSTLSSTKTFNQKEDETDTITKDSDNNSNSKPLSLCNNNNHNYYDVIIDNIKNQIFLIEELFQKEKIRYETRFNYLDSIIDLFLQMQNQLNKMKL